MHFSNILDVEELMKRLKSDGGIGGGAIAGQIGMCINHADSNCKLRLTDDWPVEDRILDVRELFIVHWSFPLFIRFNTQGRGVIKSLT